MPKARGLFKGDEMTDTELWAEFSEKFGIKNASYEAWAFGCDADELAELVKNGIKTATSSAFLLYELENELLPTVDGKYDIILDSNENAVCIIKTSKVYVVPFCEVSEEHAYREGEGDRTLSYWRRVHEQFFTEELEAVGLCFDENMKVVCEEFELVYKNRQ